MSIFDNLFHGHSTQGTVDPAVRKADATYLQMRRERFSPTEADQAVLDTFFEYNPTFRDLVYLNHERAKEVGGYHPSLEGKENGGPAALVVEGPEGLEKILRDNDHVNESFYFTRIEHGKPFIDYLKSIKDGGVVIEIREGEDGQKEPWVSNPVYFENVISRYKQRWQEEHPGQEFDVVTELKENYLPEEYVPNGTGGKKRALFISALYPGVKALALNSTVHKLAGTVVMCGEKGLEAMCSYEPAYQGGVIGILRTYGYDSDQGKIVPTEEIKFKVKKPRKYDSYHRMFVDSGEPEFKVMQRTVSNNVGLPICSIKSSLGSG